MSNDNVAEALAIMQGKLVVGNHDTISTLGIQQQGIVTEVSDKILKMVLNNNNQANAVIDEIVHKLDEIDFETDTHLSNKQLKTNRKEFAVEAFERISDYIETVSVLLKIQHAMLIKELVILNEYETILNECYSKIESCIQNAVDLLNRKESIIAGHRNDSSDIHKWFNRLESKIRDLSTMQTVVLQSSTQIHLLQNNDTLLINEILFIIDTTFPVWKTYSTFLLGIKLDNNNLSIQNQILQKTEGRLKYLSNEIKDNNTIDIFLTINKELKNILNELSTIGKNDERIRQSINAAVRLLER